MHSIINNLDTEMIKLRHMNCFKEIDTNTVDADNEEYAHVFKYKRFHGNATVLTLTKSEWEAFCTFLPLLHYISVQLSEY